MANHVRIALAVAAAVTAGLASSAARAAPVTVPNPSFENPAVPNVSPYASPLLDNWLKDGNVFSTGAFYNTPDAPPQVDNADGNQLAFIFGVPGVGLYQDLAATYAVGQSYALKVAVQGGGGGMPLNTPLQLQLYWRDPRITGGGDDRVPLATVTYKNDNASGAITHLIDQTVTLPAVTAADPWAGKAIGVRLVAVDDPAVTESGYFDVDRVRLDAVPEPAGLCGLAVAAIGLTRRRRARA